MAEKATRAGRNDGKRRGGGPRALAATLPGITRAALGRRGFAEGGLLAAWPSIVGADLAAVCLPRKLAFPDRGRRAEGTLTLRVQSGQATRLQHQAPLIIERINGYFGYRAVARLRLQQGPLGRSRAPERPEPAPLDPQQEAGLKARTATVGDAALRAALENLGRALRQRR